MGIYQKILAGKVLRQETESWDASLDVIDTLVDDEVADDHHP